MGAAESMIPGRLLRKLRKLSREWGGGRWEWAGGQKTGPDLDV